MHTKELCGKKQKHSEQREIQMTEKVLQKKKITNIISGRYNLKTIKYKKYDVVISEHSYTPDTTI